jgi:hypothetical protein
VKERSAFFSESAYEALAPDGSVATEAAAAPRFLKLAVAFKIRVLNLN